MKRPPPVRAPGRAGFSALELLGVMCVIAVIAALILMWGVGAHERSRELSCGSNLKQIAHALQLYADDYGGRLPPSDEALGHLAAVYMKNWQILKCPADDEPRPEALGEASGSSMAGKTIRHEGTDNPVSYFLVPGLATDDPPKTVTAGDTLPRHRGGGNVVCLDGHLDWLPGPELAAQLPKEATNDAD